MAADLRGDASGTRQAVIVLADIGGYTRFMRLQEHNLPHAEAVITELLGAVIDSSEHPLTFNKLEGDAALFYVEAAPGALREVAQSAQRQVNAFFGAFARRKAEVLRDATCDCGACENISFLTIKAVLHCGEIAVRKFRNAEELSGVAVITAHRLMKNSVPLKEYILVSETFDRAAGGLPGQKGVPLVENCEGVGEVKVVYYQPDEAAPLPPPAPSRWRRLILGGHMMIFLLQRKLGLLKGRSYRGLEAVVSA